MTDGAALEPEPGPASDPVAATSDLPPEAPTARLRPRDALRLLTAGSRPVTLVVFVALALAAGFLEAAVILVVLAVAAGLAAGDGRVEASLGPLDVSLTTGWGILLGLACTVAMIACAVPNAWLGARLAARTLARIRADLVRGLLTARWAQQSAVTEARFQDLAAVHAVRIAGLVLVITILITSSLGLFALVLAAVLVDVLVAAALLVVVVVLALAFRPLIQSIRRRASRFITAHHRYVEQLSELFKVLPEIRVFGVRGAAAGLLDDANQLAVREFRYSRFRGRLLPALYTGATVLLVLLGLAVASAQETLSLASFGAIVVFLLRSLRYSQQVQTSWQSVSELLPYYERLQSALDEWRPASGDFGDATLERAGTLELRDVGYVYPTGQVGIEGATVTIRPGEVIGLEGPSGAGKSTFAQVVLGLRRPTTGSYLIDGAPVESFDEASWFSRFAYVAQDSTLIDGSIRDNVRFLRPEVTDAAIDRALDEAGIGRDLADWEAGAGHQVGSGGRQLSGGQRQRIAIARALAGEPDVLVMDEPTSSLDASSEEIVRSTLLALKGRITVILIAHRRSTLTVCDRVLTVEDHHVRERAVVPADAGTEGHP